MRRGSRAPSPGPSNTRWRPTMRVVRILFLLLVLLATAAGAWLYVFARRPAVPPQSPYEFTVRPGAGLKAVSRQLAAEGLFAEGESLWILSRVLGRTATVQAGTYRLEGPLTPIELL